MDDNMKRALIISLLLMASVVALELDINEEDERKEYFAELNELW